MNYERLLKNFVRGEMDEKPAGFVRKTFQKTVSVFFNYKI